MTVSRPIDKLRRVFVPSATSGEIGKPITVQVHVSWAGPTE